MARLHSRIYLHFLGVLVVAGLAASLVFAVGARAHLRARGGGADGAPRGLPGRRALRRSSRPRRAAAPAPRRSRHRRGGARSRRARRRGVGPRAPTALEQAGGHRARGYRRRRLAPDVARSSPGPGPADEGHRRDAGRSDPAPIRRPAPLVARAGGDGHPARGGGRDAAPGAPDLAPTRAPHRGRAPPRPRRPRRARSRYSCARVAPVDAALFTRRR